MSMIAEKNDYIVVIERDEEPMNPCVDYDLLGNMACVHSRYNLGTEQFSSPDELFLSLLEKVKGVEGAETFWCEMEDRIFGDAPATNETLRQFQSEMVDFLSQEYVLMPLYLYDHSGLSISTESFHDPWDSGQVGFVYLSNENAIKDRVPISELDQAIMTDELREQTKDTLRSEVELYNHYLQGDSYGYQLFQNGEEIDSCWGFLGDFDSMITEIALDLPEEFKNLKEMLHEDNNPLLTSVINAPPETKESIFKVLAQNKELVEHAKQKESPLPTRSGDVR